MPSSPRDELVAVPLTDTAARIAAMLDRWAAEDVSNEPEWDIEAIPRMTIDGLHADGTRDEGT